jgi:hypothetical protein
MPAALEHAPSLAGRLAENLLKAWLSGDAVRVHSELERSLSVPVEQAYDTGEQERRQLLQAVAGQMRRCPDLLELGTQSPKLKLYLHLLWHLVPRN